MFIREAHQEYNWRVIIVTREKYPSPPPGGGILFKNSQLVKTIPLPPLKFDV